MLIAVLPPIPPESTLSFGLHIVSNEFYRSIEKGWCWPGGLSVKIEPGEKR